MKLMELKCMNGFLIDESFRTIRLWDFAGQEIFYTTHQFFLSQNSISFLLFNLTEDLNYESKLEFWINSIQYRAPKSKLFINFKFLFLKYIYFITLFLIEGFIP